MVPKKVVQGVFNSEMLDNLESKWVVGIDLVMGLSCQSQGSFLLIWNFYST